MKTNNLIKDYKFKTNLKQFRPYWRYAKYKGENCKVYFPNDVDIAGFNNLVDNVLEGIEKNGYQKVKDEIKSLKVDLNKPKRQVLVEYESGEQELIDIDDPQLIIVTDPELIKKGLSIGKC
ncbi:MAG: hypothetical protein IMZ52_09545 [Actinobacteria bacterium]|nr:hypothetical protein [Actinomycetota bacterium]